MMVSLICLAFALSLDVAWLYILTAVLAIGILFALYFAIRWLFVLQTVMLEGRRITQTIPRSSDLVAGNWWRSFGIWALFAAIVPLIVGFVSGLLLAVLMAFGRLGGSGVFGIVVYLNIVPALVLVPLSAVAQTVLYFDLRAGKEQYSPEILASELGRQPPVAPAMAVPEYAQQMEAVYTWKPRRLNPVFIAVAVVVLLSALVPPAYFLLPEYVDRGDIQVFVRRVPTGRQVEIGHGTLETFKFTDFVLVVDFNASVEAGDADNVIVADVKPWGDDYWMHSPATVQVFVEEGSVQGAKTYLATPEVDPDNEVDTTIEILDEKRILVSPVAGEFPSGSQLVLWLDFGGGSGWCARMFTR
jgi:hypothetical protein